MRKTTIQTLLAIMMVTMTAACQKDDATETNSQISYIGDSNAAGGGSGSSAISVGSGDLTSFTVAIDSTTAEPTAAASAIYPSEEDSVSVSTFTNEVHIVFNGNTATCSAQSGVTSSISGAHVTVDHGSTKNVCYVVSGNSTAGSLTVVGEKKYALKLNGVSIANSDSSAINLLSKKRAYIELCNGTTNTIKDGTTTQAEDHKAAFYAKGKMLFSGDGLLRVYGNYNNGLGCADYIVFNSGNNIYAKSTANNAIKANDGIYVNGGIINVEATAVAGKGINCESNIVINGGRTTAITTGNGTYDSDEQDTKAAAGVACDSVFTMNGGELYVRSTGSGGKGIKADWEAYINGGTIHAITEGSQYRYSSSLTSSPKGIKVGTKNTHGILNITDGTIMVRTSGSNGEGIESKGTLSISGGTVQISAYDDAINSAGDLTISGGSVVAVGKNSDGLDSNGNMYIKGGNIVAYGASGAESGIDVNENKQLYISGGAFFSIGGRIDASAGSSSQGIITTSGSTTANSTVTISSGNTTLATFTMPPYAYSNGTIMATAAGITSGSSYILAIGSTTQTVTAASSASSGMGGAGMQNGGMGGGPMSGGHPM